MGAAFAVATWRGPDWNVIMHGEKGACNLPEVSMMQVIEDPHNLRDDAPALGPEDILSANARYVLARRCARTRAIRRHDLLGRARPFRGARGDRRTANSEHGPVRREEQLASDSQQRGDASSRPRSGSGSDA